MTASLLMGRQGYEDEDYEEFVVRRVHVMEDDAFKNVFNTNAELSKLPHVARIMSSLTINQTSQVRQSHTMVP